MMNKQADFRYGQWLWRISGFGVGEQGRWRLQHHGTAKESCDEMIK